MFFHSPAHEFACTGCGWIPDSELRATGSIWPADENPPRRRPVVRLAVIRCPGCGLDEVTDIETGEVWDLEASDYTDTGSWPGNEPVQDTLF